MKFLSVFLLTVSVALAQFEPKQLTNVVSDSLVRPNNATAYAVNDVVNDTASTAKILAFKYAGKIAKGSGVIVSALLEIDSANTTNGTFKLLLFSDTVATAADNSAWAPAHANNDRFIGSVDFSLASNGTGVAMAESNGLVIPFQSSGRISGGYIFGVLIAKAAYTPKTLGKYRVKLGILRD